jgi:integrase
MKAKIGAALISRIKPADKPYEIRDEQLIGFLVRVQPSGTMTYYAEYGRGKRMRIGAAGGALKPEAARNKAKEILAGAILGEDPMAAKREAKAHTLATFVSEVYGPWGEGTIKTADETLRSLRVSFADFQKRKLADISPWLVEKWRAARLKGGAKPASVNRDLDNLKSALNRAVEWNHLDANPLATVKRTKADRAATVRYLSPDEERALLAALSARDVRLQAERESANQWRTERGYPLLPALFDFGDHLTPLVVLSLHTGLRRGEAFSLDWHDVDLDRAMLTVRGEKAKSGATRHVPLNATAVDVLSRWGGGDGLVFPARNGGRLNNVNKAWKRVLADARIERFRWHDLRHTFASKLVMAGVDLNTVRELLGHSTITMTLRYAHLAPEHKASAVARLVAS